LVRLAEFGCGDEDDVGSGFCYRTRSEPECVREVTDPNVVGMPGNLLARESEFVGK
jgi:hypothetical protein